MLTKLLVLAVLAIAVFTLAAAFTQRSAFVLRQETQPYYWSRHNTQTSGSYSGGSWRSNPVRTSYDQFRGGGPGVGK
jgi:hypothetical protein